MSSDQPSTTTAAFRDQSTGLMIWGILQMMIGCSWRLTAPLAIFGALVTARAGAAAGPQIDPKMMIPGIAMYLVLGAAFIWLGIGSIQARRWAWSLTVVLSWLWLIGGVACLIYMVLLAPVMRVSMQTAMQQEIDKQVKIQRQAEIQRQAAIKRPLKGGPPVNAPQVTIAPPVITPAMITAMLVIGFAVTAVFMLLLPAAFLVFYQRASVRATCQRRDPRARWTDRCPMPVLAVSLTLAFTGLWMLCAAVSQPVLPLFGRLLAGPAVPALMLLMALIAIWLAWASYRLKMVAWWGTLLLCAAGTVSSVLTLMRPDVLEKMEDKMNIPAAQLAVLRKAGFFETLAKMQWLCALTGIGVLCYLLYVRRYFVRGGRLEQTTSGATDLN